MFALAYWAVRHVILQRAQCGSWKTLHLVVAAPCGAVYLESAPDRELPSSISNYVIPLPFLSSLNAFFTIAPHIFAYGFVLTLISLAASSPYRAAAAKSFDASSSSSLFPRPLSSVPVSLAFRYKKARCEYAVRRMRAWYADTGAVAEDVGSERWMARDRSVKSASMSESDAEKMLLSLGKEASIRILRNCARLTKALGYVGLVAMMLSSSCIPASTNSELESLDVRRMMPFCCVSRMDSCDEEMVGCGGNVVSMADASFDFATDDGSVSGSKSAFNMRASFADSDVLIVSTAIVVDCGLLRSQALGVVLWRPNVALVEERFVSVKFWLLFLIVLGFQSDIIWYECEVRLSSLRAGQQRIL